MGEPEGGARELFVLKYCNGLSLSGRAAAAAVAAAERRITFSFSIIINFYNLVLLPAINFRPYPRYSAVVFVSFKAVKLP